MNAVTNRFPYLNKLPSLIDNQKKKWLGKCISRTLTTIQVIHGMYLLVIFLNSLKQLIKGIKQLTHLVIKKLEAIEINKKNLQKYKTYFDLLSIDITKDNLNHCMILPYTDFTFNDLENYWIRCSKTSIPPLTIGFINHENCEIPFVCIKAKCTKYQAYCMPEIAAKPLFLILKERTDHNFRWGQLFIKPKTSKETLWPKSSLNSDLLSEKFVYSSNKLQRTRTVLFEGNNADTKDIKNLIKNCVIAKNNNLYTISGISRVSFGKMYNTFVKIINIPNFFSNY